MLTTLGLPVVVWLDRKALAFSNYVWRWRCLLEDTGETVLG